MSREKQLLIFCMILVSGVILDLAPIKVPDGVDKIYHFLGFAIITMSAISTFIAFCGKKYFNQFLMLVLVFGGIASGVGEFLQRFVSVREVSVADWITNILAITFIVIIAYIGNSKDSKQKEISDEVFEFKNFPVIS